MSYSPPSSWFKISKKITSLALPMAGSQLLNVGSIFICMAMLSTLGHEVLAASALIFSTQISMMLSGMSLLFSVGILVGRAHGAQNNFLARGYLQKAWILAVFIGTLIIYILWHIEQLYLFFGQSRAIAHHVATYFHTFVWAVIPSLLSTCNMHFGYGMQQKKLIFWLNTLSVVLLLFISYGLILGTMGLPQLGIKGLAIAITVQQVFFFTVTTGAFFWKRNNLPLHLAPSQILHHLNQLQDLIRVGWPIFLQTTGEMLSFFLGSMMIGWLGTDTLAAFQVVNQYYFLLVIPVFSLSQASSILISQACGAKDLQQVSQLGYASMGMVLIASLLILSVFLFFPETLASFYLNPSQSAHDETLQLAILIFSITAFSQLFDSFRKLLTGLLRGLLDTKLPMFISLLTLWGIGIPCSYLFAFHFELGIIGYLTGGMLGMLLGVMLLGWHWYLQISAHDLLVSPN